MRCIEMRIFRISRTDRVVDSVVDFRPPEISRARFLIRIIQGFPANNFGARMLAMAKPAFNAILRHSPRKPCLVFTPSRRQAQLTAIDVASFRAAGAGNAPPHSEWTT